MTGQNEIGVLVVDDSAVVRSLIADSIAATPGMKVIGTAGDGQLALAVLDDLRPDVITLDIRMPNMDGLATLDAILSRRPVPVVMVSSFTTVGANLTLAALDRGAVDYLEKPDRGSDTHAILRGELPRKIRMAAGVDVGRIMEIRRARKQQRPASAFQRCPGERTCGPELAGKCIVIGVSTGGPPALASLFQSLRPPMPPILVVQHMPATFTKPFASRLDSLGELTVREAGNGELLKPNHVWIAPGGQHLSIHRFGASVKTVVRPGTPVSGHMPSADVLMKSAAEIFGPKCLGVIMTGMGRDGVDGCGAIRTAGGYVLGQDEASSDVYGMNKLAYLAGHVDRQFSLTEMASALTRCVHAGNRRTSSNP